MLMNEKQIKNKIIRNKKVFEDLKSLALEEKNENLQLKLLEVTAYWASSNSIMKYSDKEIEKKLCTISQKYHVAQHDFEAGSFLHVATEVYTVGGHTRLINNWLINSDNSEKHSLVLTNQKNGTIPSWLEKSVEEKSGHIYYLDNEDYIANALELRELASKYEYIVLYTHMYDIRPLIAFATEEFKRPVIVYNHADHIFWLGLSITDVLLELSHDGKNFSLKNRGKRISKVLSIPISSDFEKIHHQSNEKKIIVSMASPYKYEPFDNYNFIQTAQEILEKNPNAHFIVIGPNKHEHKEWGKAFDETKGRLDAVGYKQKDEVLLYKRMAYLYIDSFPFYSYTSMLEFAILGIPVLTLNTPVSKLDIIHEKGILCKDSKEMVYKANEILHAENVSDKYLISKELKKLYSDHTWRIEKDKIIQHTSKCHNLNFTFSKKNIINDYDIFLQKIFMTNSKTFFLEYNLGKIMNFRIFLILLRNKNINKNFFITVVKKKIINLKNYKKLRSIRRIALHEK